MKTLEQKAKAYDKALERAKKLQETCDSTAVVGWCEYIFPELKQSEDEKIRKALISVFSNREKYLIDQSFGDITVSEALTWLEKQGKQGKQVPFPKFTFDDVLALQCCMETVKKVQEDNELYEQLQSLHDRLHDAYWLEKQGEESNDKVEPKFKVGDRITKSSKKSCPVHSSIDDTICEVAEVHDTCYILNTKEGRIQEPFEWQDYYELVEPAWGEEDEHRIKDIIYFLDTAKKHYASTVELDACIDWLKSLKQRIGG